MAASLTGVFSAGEGAGAVTTGSRTSASGSLITAIGGCWNGATLSNFTDSFTNSYTEQVDITLDQTDAEGNNGRANLGYNAGGTRGASHTISKADDGNGNTIGGQEWAGVASSPTVASATANGNSTAPSASVAVGAASLAVLVFGYADTSTTMAVNDGTEAQEIDENSDFQAIALHYKVGQTGTPSITGTLGATRQWGAAIVTFTESSAGTTISPGAGSMPLTGRVMDVIETMANDARIVFRKA